MKSKLTKIWFVAIAMMLILSFAIAQDGMLLPPNALPGECYARVFVPPTSKTVTETLLKKAATERIEIIPAQYETVDETVLVKEASTKLVNVPAKYGKESAQVLVSGEQLFWKTNLTGNQAASDALLDAAKRGGINLATAQPGDCFHEHYIAPTFETVTEEVMLEEASDKVEIIPAVYETVEETVLVKEASTRLTNVPAKYGKESAQVLVSGEQLIWKTNLKSNSQEASDALLDAAKRGGINLATAQPGECYHEHYIAPTFETVTEEVMVEEASDKIEISPAVYETVEETVLVKEASTRLKNIPTTYRWEEENILIAEAHTEWKEGRGLIEKVDNTTGEIMCLIEVPAVYKTVKTQVVDKEAYVETIQIPAEYKTVKVRKLVQAAQENRIAIPAKYRTVSSKKQATDGHFEWHEIHVMDLPEETRTGKQICLTKIPEKYRTDTKTVLVEAAGTKIVEIPAEYKTVKVRKLVQGAQEKRIAIPAKYRTVSSKKQVTDGRFEWHEIHVMDLPEITRTGNQICLTKIPEKYRTDTKTVLVAAAGTKTVDIDAEYKTVMVRKLVQSAQEKRIAIPAEYQTVTRTEKVSDGFLEWRWVLCETNMTRDTMSKIQNALNAKGYDVGVADGRLGNRTSAALNKFQVDNGLATGGITKEALKALGVNL